MIENILVSNTDKDFVSRYCGVLQYTITWPSEFSSFATTNVPLAGQTFNFNIDAKTNDQLGKFEFWVKAKFSKPNLLDISYTYKFNVVLTPCRVIKSVIDSTSLKPLYTYEVLGS